MCSPHELAHSLTVCLEVICYNTKRSHDVLYILIDLLHDTAFIRKAAREVSGVSRVASVSLARSSVMFLLASFVYAKYVLFLCFQRCPINGFVPSLNALISYDFVLYAIDRGDMIISESAVRSSRGQITHRLQFYNAVISTSTHESLHITASLGY